MYPEVIKTKGTIAQQSDSAGGAKLVSTPVIGTIVSSVDQNRSGAMLVRIAKWSGPDETRGLFRVKYASPFAGYTSGSAADNNYGDYTSAPQSYGMWFTPPDAGTEILCVFINGDPNQGYFLGCIPRAGSLHMTPAIAGSVNIVPNASEATTYGGARRLPVTEINTNNDALALNPEFFRQARPIHSYQAAILNRQGTITDPIRGVIGSNAMRESPSAVFGFSTPGRAVYSGGLSDKAASTAAETPDTELQVIARRGGHSIVLDDGDTNGADQLIRIRTAQGHQITMSDDGQTLLIIHSNGQSYIELGKEGTIDVYSTNSLNIRTQGDLNLHADRDINMNAGGNITTNSTAFRTDTEAEMRVRTGQDFSIDSQARVTARSAADTLFTVGGTAGITAAGQTLITGRQVHMNGPRAAAAPALTVLTKNLHSDTKNTSKGFINSAGQLESIVTRAPAHFPWPEAGRGVAVKSSLAAPGGAATAPAPQQAAITQAAPAAPTVPTQAAAVATAPTAPAVGNMKPDIVRAAVSQTAATNSSVVASVRNAATGQAAGITQAINGQAQAVVGQLAQTPQQLEAAGIIKPGSSAFVQQVAATTGNINLAYPRSVFTGVGTATSLSGYTSSLGLQTTAAATAMANSYQQLVASGTVNPQSAGTQTVGSVLAATQAGAQAVISFAGSSGLGGAAGTVAAVAGAASQLASATNLSTKTIPELVSAGNFAGGLADKGVGSLGDLASLAKQGAQAVGRGVNSIGRGIGSAVMSLESSAQSLFRSAVASVPDLEAGVPNDLTVVAQQAQASTLSLKDVTQGMARGANAVSGAVTGAAGASGNLVAGLAQGNAQSITNLVSGAGRLVTGVTNATTGQVLATAQGAGQVLSSTGVRVPTVAGSSLDSFASLATTATPSFNPSALASAFSLPSVEAPSALAMSSAVASQLNSLMAVSGSQLKLPAVASATLTDGLALAQQQSGLVGSTKVAAVLPNYTAAPPTPVSLSLQPNPLYDKYVAAQAEAEELMWEAQRARPDPALAGTPEYLEAEEKYKTALAVYRVAERDYQAALKAYVDSQTTQRPSAPAAGSRTLRA